MLKEIMGAPTSGAGMITGVLYTFWPIDSEESPTATAKKMIYREPAKGFEVPV